MSQHFARDWTRRQFVTNTASAAGALAIGSTLRADESATVKTEEQALVAITLDLEMSRNFPSWEDTEWDYHKGNLTEPVKRYAVDTCRRVKERGGVVHTFVVGQVFEQANVDWLQ